MNDGYQSIYDTLKSYFGYDEFRPLQREIIEDTLGGRDTFVLMPTGGGKSLCYQLPALHSKGLVIVVSPLIALMKDQVDSLNEIGITATFLNSSLDPQENEHRKDLVRRGAVKLLYCAPERLLIPEFLSFVSKLPIAYFAIDEAHCISEWGHDFRVEYRQLSILKKRFPKTPIIALTATATTRVADDIVQQLQLKSVKRYKASFNRPNLTYLVRPKQETFDELIGFLKSHKDESGIIYCMSRDSTERLAEKLKAKGFKALAYHAGLDSKLRSKNQELFIRDKVDIICATIAFGMGIDKSNVRFVVHYDISKNLEGYYQETGRAGRDGLPSDCLLFYSRSDKIKIERFIQDISDPKIAQHQRLALAEMCNYAELTSCRKSYVLEYFGEEMTQSNCGACDNCLGITNRSAKVDLTIEAQKFLSTVIRTKEGFGAGYITEILMGEDNDRILHNRHHTLTTFGIGKDHKKKVWHHIGQELEREKYLVRYGEYGVLRLTPKAKTAIESKSPIWLSAIPDRAKKELREQKSRTAIADMPEMNAKLFDVLRGVRSTIAAGRDVPPYVIFHDTVLKQMTALLPETIDDLLKLSGVGKKKANDFGHFFITAIAEFRTGHTGITTVELKQEEPVTPKFKETAFESISLFAKGKTIEEIAIERRLSKATVAEHLGDGLLTGVINSLDRLVAIEKTEKIRKALIETKAIFLKPVMEYLNDPSISYDEIKFVRAFDNRNTNIKKY